MGKYENGQIKNKDIEAAVIVGEIMIGYTIRGASDNKVRSGWMFTNVLAYTNNRVSPNYLQLFAYVGGKQSLQNASKNKASQYENVQFTIVNAAAVAAAEDKKKVKK